MSTVTITCSDRALKGELSDEFLRSSRAMQLSIRIGELIGGESPSVTWIQALPGGINQPDVEIRIEWESALESQGGERKLSNDLLNQIIIWLREISFFPEHSVRVRVIPHHNEIRGDLSFV